MTPPTPARAFEPISPNPYIVGNAVRDPSMFFGREAEFELVRNRFVQSRHGCLMVFCGERRSGKTSILLQIQQGRLGPEFVPVLIDMQAMAVPGEVEFLSRIADQIVKQLRRSGNELDPPAFRGQSNPSSVFLEFIDSVLERHRKRKLVLLFDEYELLEDKIDNGTLTRDVLLILSSLMESAPVFLVFTGSRNLEERRKDYWRILHKAHEYRHISYLETTDAIRLIREPVTGRATYPDGLVTRILRLTAGHPFYTQAICQKLVDLLNEKRTNFVTAAMLDAVVEQIVQYPFPQMTFLWETLETDQKLTLALLAQTLEKQDRFASAETVLRAVRKGGYPLALSQPTVAAALEGAFQEELLAKNEERDPGYSFRMDLWRLWIARMHSVWRIMREEGLLGRKRARARVLVAAAGAAVVIFGLGLWVASSSRRAPAPATAAIRTDAVPPPATAFVSLEPSPADARIFLEGALVSVGSYRGSVSAGEELSFEVRAPGYFDSTVVLLPAPRESTLVPVALRPELGSIRIAVEPEEARIYVDGENVGAGTALREDLPVPANHVVEARLEGHHPVVRSVRLAPDSTLDVAIDLSPLTLNFNVVTSPDGAEILVDGMRKGTSPLVVSELPYGEHQLEARLAGHVPADTTILIDGATTHLRLSLASLPPGILIVHGDLPARIYVDERQIGSGELPSSGETRVAAGEHTVEVLFRDGTKDTMTVHVAPDETIELCWVEKKLRLCED